MVMESLRLAVVNAGLPGIMAAPTYGLLKKVMQRTLLEVLDENQIPYRHFIADKRLVITAGGLNSEINFTSLDNPEAQRGSNAAWIAVDEMTYCKQDAWLRLQARLRHPKATELSAIAAWTPKGFDWVYDDFVAGGKPEHLAILATPLENYHVGNTGYYESLKGSYDSKFFQQEALGEYLDLRSGSVYYEFKRDVHVRKLPRRPDAQLWVTCDFNINPMVWLVCQIVGGKTVEVLDEVSMPGTIGEACEVLQGKIEALLSDVERERIRRGMFVEIPVTGDAAGNSRTHAGKSDWALVFEYFARTKFKLLDQVPRADPPVRDRVNSVNAMLRNAQGDVRLVLDESCKETIADLARVVWKTDSNKNILSLLDKSDPKRTHASDALGYLIHREFRVSGFQREVLY